MFINKRCECTNSSESSTVFANRVNEGVSGVSVMTDSEFNTMLLPIVSVNLPSDISQANFVVTTAIDLYLWYT
jgi:hypothetical protein